jgi:hypothetical protein
MRVWCLKGAGVVFSRHYMCILCEASAFLWAFLVILWPCGHGMGVLD